ncbi:MAG: zinc ABC transporter permease subunit ZnuB [Cocleimonas sp.]
MDDFLIRALIAGLLITLIAGPLGAFILWRRMAYFGDTLSHSAILGVALGFLLAININIGILISTLLVAFLLILSQRQKKLGSDTMLGIMAHSALSLGLIIISFVEGVRVDINAWLFGDILSVSWQDLGVISAGVMLIIIILFFIWKPLLSLTVHQELAEVEGVNASIIGAAYTLLIAILVAVAMKVIGALLITSLLIIPAAAARQFSRSPEQMAFFAIIVGMLAVVFGLSASFLWDTPAGPSIVVAASGLFLLSQIAGKAK